MMGARVNQAREVNSTISISARFTEPAVIAKSSLGLDVKPWDDETDMKKLEECVRSITMDGLLWGQCKYRGL